MFNNKKESKGRGRPRVHEELPPGEIRKMISPEAYDHRDDEESRERISLTRAKAERITWQSEVERLHHAVMTGSLIEIRKVQNEAFAVGRQLRGDLFAIPARVTDKIISQRQSGDVEYNGIYDLILNEIRAILNDLHEKLLKERFGCNFEF